MLMVVIRGSKRVRERGREERECARVWGGKWGKETNLVDSLLELGETVGHYGGSDAGLLEVLRQVQKEVRGCKDVRFPKTGRVVLEACPVFVSQSN